MAAQSGSDDELKDLLRQVIASNLTTAYFVEHLRREMHPRDEKLHAFAQVLEVFEMVHEVMEPDDDEDDSDLAADLADPEDLEDRGVSRAGPRSPFESTLRYLRPKKKKPTGG